MTGSCMILKQGIGEFSPSLKRFSIVFLSNLKYTEIYQRSMYFASPLLALVVQ